MKVQPASDTATPTAVDASPAQTNSYFQSVCSFLYGKWRQPSRADVGNGNPTVTVSLKVGPDGSVLSKRVVRTSGIPAMDRSVATLLAGLSSLPAPKTFGIDQSSMEIEVVFELD